MFSKFQFEYLNILIFFIIVFIVAFILVILTLFLSRKRFLNEKVSLYECGFEPFNDARQPFNLNFYNIALAFLLFDVEIILLLPGLASFNFLPVVGRLWFIGFLIVLIIGFIYEFNIGAFVVHKKDKIINKSHQGFEEQKYSV